MDASRTDVFAGRYGAAKLPDRDISSQGDTIEALREKRIGVIYDDLELDLGEVRIIFVLHYFKSLNWQFKT